MKMGIVFLLFVLDIMTYENLHFVFSSKGVL